MIKSSQFKLGPYNRGAHLVTQDIKSYLPELPEKGILNLFIQHTSAALSINENADPTVRLDLTRSLDELVKENEPYYTHVAEGADDMPAHIKSTLVGASVNIPIINSKLALGTWQGVYLCEFRDHADARNIVATIYY